MNFPCPYCKRELNLMELQAESDLMAIIRMSASFGKHNNLVWAYAELFGITPMRAKAKKLRLILEELKKLFDGGGFGYQKRLYRITPEGIAEALNVVVKKNFADGLDSHNYLKKVMINIADREEKASGRRTEKDLRAKEASIMSGSREYPVQEEQVEAPRMKTMPRAMPLTDAELEVNRQRLKKMIKEIG